MGHCWLLSPQNTLEMPWSGTGTTGRRGLLSRGSAAMPMRTVWRSGRGYAPESMDLNVGSLRDSQEVRCEGHG
jgi:hypothetical protein